MANTEILGEVRKSNDYCTLHKHVESKQIYLKANLFRKYCRSTKMEKNTFMLKLTVFTLNEFKER